MHKSGVILTLTDEKTKRIIYERKGRKSKVIRLALTDFIVMKWVLKNDVFGVVKNTMQFENIWEYFAALKKKDKENNEEED